jgi:deoxycytidine triphosphate deaminase
MTSSVLSDGTIRRLVQEGRIRITPWDPSMVQPASVDLRLGASFLVFHNFRVPAIDLADPPSNLTEQVKIEDGGSFVIHPGEFVLGRTEEFVELPDDVVARIEGKALALDTEVPTPLGWRTMGALRAGDEVFGPDGEPRPVVAVSEVMTGRECREVVFSDDTSVIADVDHQWDVASKYDRARGATRVLTTAEIERAGVKLGREYRFHVRQSLPLRYPERSLPVDPYVFGVWIGDGGRVAPDRRRAEQVVGAVAVGRDCGPKYEIEFTPDRPVFRLQRKRLRQKDVGVFTRGRAIVDIRPTPSVPVRCIQVGAADGLFLVTRSCIPTHNSSLGRLGLIVHATAGFVDPGFKGTLTLEITNLTRVPIILWPGKPIAQLSFMTLDAPAERPYGHPELGSHYQGQVEATESRYEGGPAAPADPVD